MTSDSSNKYIGKVKWFNNKSGYGFITVLSGDRKNEDMFAHHSSLLVKSEQYKFLVQGEYVEFEVSKVESGSHEYQAVNITGLQRDDLMCETRFKNRDTRTETRRPDRGRYRVQGSVEN